MANQQEIIDWREKRVKELLDPEGWLTLAGLFWLDTNGINSIGSQDSCKVVLPAVSGVPTLLGQIRFEASTIKFAIADNHQVLLRQGNSEYVLTKASGEVDLSHDMVKSGPSKIYVTGSSVLFYVIQRQDKYGIRIKNSDHPSRKNFHGIRYFEIAPQWKIEALYEPFETPKKVPIKTVLDTETTETFPGKVTFEVEGKQFSLDCIDEDDPKNLFLIFKDNTNGKETYGMRYLYVEISQPNTQKQKVTVDFNKSYNPPCSFTDYATCPVPPKQNHLPFRVEAGELLYEEH